MARCRTHKIPWLTTQIILVRAPSKQTRRQPFCAAARPRRPSGPSAAWRRRFTRARRVRALGARKKSAAGPATALVGAPCNKRVLRGWSRLFVASVLPLAWRARDDVEASCAPSTSGKRIPVLPFFFCGACPAWQASKKCVELQLSAVREGQ